MRWKRENEHLTWWLTELQKHVKAESHDDRSFVDVWGRNAELEAESHEAPLSHLNALLIFSFEYYGTHLFSFEYTRLNTVQVCGHNVATRRFEMNTRKSKWKKIQEMALKLVNWQKKKSKHHRLASWSLRKLSIVKFEFILPRQWHGIYGRALKHRSSTLNLIAIDFWTTVSGF